MIPVSSSNLAAVDYDGLSKTLTVEFRSGAVYNYYDVPRSVFQLLMTSASHGRYFERSIRYEYEYERIS